MTNKPQPQREHAKPNTKIEMVLALLSQAGGATLDDLGKATGWQKHTIRASLTDLRKKCYTFESVQVDDLSYYVLAPEAGQ